MHGGGFAQRGGRTCVGPEHNGNVRMPVPAPPIYSNADAVQAYRCNVEVIFNYDDAVVVKHVEHVCEGKPEMPCDLVISDKIAVLGRMRWNGQIWLLFRTK